jgi:hypothetical protein
LETAAEYNKLENMFDVH